MQNLRIPLEIPTRVSLAAQIAAAIRKAIEAGTWADYLPTERHLGEMFQVSRPTLRVALHLLANEGLIEITPGRGSRLLKRAVRQSAMKNRLVAVITPQPVFDLGLTYQGVNEMRAHLAKLGFATEVVLCQAQGAAAERFVANYLQRNRVFCCVLLSVSERLQRWFSTHSIPALVLGSCHPSVSLPSLDFDNRAVCRHAAGVFAQRGHRRIALLTPDSGLAGDLVGEQGFLEAVAEHPALARSDCRIVHHDATAPSITGRLDGLLRSAAPPTGLLIANTDEAFIVMMHLLRRGLPVPDRISLISRDHHRIYDILSPAVAHYKAEPGIFEHRLSRLMLQMVSQGYLAPEATLIVPKFFAGGTVKTLA